MILCDKRQQILGSDQHLLVSGGPGSGKTTIALRKALRAIEIGMRPGQSILFLSFSRAAVARIAEASGSIIKDSQKRTLQIQTFHSFFWEILRVHGYLLGPAKKLRLILPHEEKVLTDGQKFEYDSPGWKAWVSERERLFNSESRIVFDLFAPKVNALLSRSNAITQLISSRYPLIIVDEAQDTSSEQWSCIKHLSKRSQVICLADLEQQIYDFLPGVGPERIADIKSDLHPVEVDLGSDNNRSPNTDIIHYGNDILSARRSLATYRGISYHTFSRKAVDRDTAIRKAVGMINQKIENETGKRPESLAFLTSSEKGAVIVSNALRSGNRPIPHKILFDETGTLLSCNFLSFLLEPKHKEDHPFNVGVALQLIAEIQRAKGGVTALKLAAVLNKASLNIVNGVSLPNTRLCKYVEGLITCLEGYRFTGDPKKDWSKVREMLLVSGVPELVSMGYDLQYVMAYNRGKQISSGLAYVWEDSGNYINARQVVDNALAADQIMSGAEDLSGIHVMTMHKSKGKQFDGVILLRAQHISSFDWKNDDARYSKSRKVLRVAITRAKVHTLILNEVYPSCPILAPFMKINNS